MFHNLHLGLYLPQNTLTTTTSTFQFETKKLFEVIIFYHELMKDKSNIADGRCIALLNQTNIYSASIAGRLPVYNFFYL